MAGERNYLRVPPDSTGKKLRIVHNAQLTFTNMSSNYTWKIDRNDYMLGDGWSFHLHSVFQQTTTSGLLEVSYSKTATFSNFVPTTGTSIIDPDTEQVVAYISGYEDVFVNASNIVGFENPSQGVNVDQTGSLNVRFAEGLPQLDAFGKLRVSNATLLGEYTFVNSVLPDKFSSTLSHSGASISWDQYKRALLLTVDTSAGAIAAHTTNTYHHYFPGASQVAMMTLALGDSGKTGMGRGWGLYDELNGFHFLHKNGRLGVSIKSNTSGTVQDIYFWQDPVVGEQGWNGDKLDGTGPSGMVIDVTKDNLYWVDEQWLGAGRVRFGVYYNGDRIVCHEYNHANTQPVPFSATGSLPLTFTQRNITATGSSSEMRVFCCTVWTEASVNVIAQGQPDQRCVDVTIPATNDQYYYVSTLSPQESYATGNVNRTIYFPTNINVMAFDTTTGLPALVDVEIIAEPVLSGLSFVATDSYSTVVYDRGPYDSDATVAGNSTTVYHGGGHSIYKCFVNGTDVYDLSSVYNNMVSGSVKNYAAGGGFITGYIDTITQGLNTVEVTFQSGRVPYRETTNTIEIHDVTVNGGTLSSINDTAFYVKVVGVNKLELWQNYDPNLPYGSRYSGPVTLTGTHDATSGITHGLYGSQFYWTIVVKKLYGSNPVRVISKVSWKELRQ